MPSIIFTNPKFSNEGIIKLFHELCHSIFLKSILYNQNNPRLNMELYNAYKTLIKESGLANLILISKLTGPLKEIEDNDYFSIFDESSYISGIDISYGHPYSDHNELFASALTVFRYFPDEFIERYRKLSSDKQKVIGEVVKTIFSVLESINSDNINNLLPKYNSLKNLIKEPENK